MITTKATCINKELSPSEEVSLVTFRVEKTTTFLAGQFMMIEADCRGTHLKKPYSIATSPKQLREDKLIGFYVKKTSEKGLSAWLTEGIKKGDEVLLQGPVGHYTRNDDFKDHLLISTGSGLSPNLSLFQDIVQGGDYHRVVSLFGERYAKHTVNAATEILTHHNHPEVYTYNFLSKEKSLPKGWHPGRIQKGLDKAFRHFHNLHHVQVFLCGGFGMVKEVGELLQDKGIPKENITLEKW